MSFTIVSSLKHTPNIPFATIKRDILGVHYECTLHIVGTKRAITINKLSRKKDYPPNVLSFPYTDSLGEIFLCPTVAQREASDYGMSIDGYTTFLFIHGLLHLKGYDHGDEMETLEKKYIRKYKLV
jgi:probable rRNA maturation factor